VAITNDRHFNYGQQQGFTQEKIRDTDRAEVAGPKKLANVFSLLDYLA
jgi:hypothetical protein